MPNSYINPLQRHCFVMSLTFLVLIESIYSTTISASNRTKLVLHLVHRDAILHRPFTNPNLIISAFNNTSIFNTSSSRKDVRGPLIPDQEAAIFLVNISIGEPPIPQLLAMDTASPLTWVHHLRCVGCTPASSATYDPTMSSTCKTLSCNSRLQCQNYIDDSYCGQEHQCIYFVPYLDGSVSNGILALEKFKFVTSTGGEWEIPNLAFGYGLESSGSVNRISGILGLETFNKNSLVSRVGNRFSYCIGNISDPHYAYNRLTLGKGAVLEGYSTPLGTWQGHYAVTLKGIRVGEKELNIGVFDVKVVIDSGATLTYLNRRLVEQMRQEVTHLLDSHLQREMYSRDDDLCYKGDLRRDLGGFPMVTLRLAEGAEIYLNVESVFRRVADNVFCMAVAVSISGVNIIGVLAQQYYNIGFDLDAMRVSFMSMECELLED